MHEVARQQAQSFLRDYHQQKILAAYEAFDNQAGFASVSTLDQIANKGYSLAIPLYVTGDSTASTAVAIDIEDAVTAWRVAAVASQTALDGVLALLREETVK